MDVGKFYDEFSGFQTNAGINHRHLRIQKYLENSGLGNAKTILEIGCGIGTQTELMLSFVVSDCQLTAVDISPKSVELAKKRLAKFRNVKILVADILKIELDEKFDLIVLPDVLEHIPLENHFNLFFKLNHVLSENGKIIINMPHPDFQEHLIMTRPNEMQIIDQPVHLSSLSSILDRTYMVIDQLFSYSVYNKPYDYQYIVIRKKVTSFIRVERPLNDPFLRRLKRKMNVGYRMLQHVWNRR